MATSGKATPAVRARIAHWRRFGLGSDAIAKRLASEGIAISSRSVRNVLAAAAERKATSTRKGGGRKRRSSTNAGVAARATTPRRPAPPPTLKATLRSTSATLDASSPATRAATVAGEAAAELEDLAGDQADVLVRLRQRHREVRELATEIQALAKAGGQNARIYALLVRLEGDLAANIQALTPPEPPDPTTDPANVAAKELLIASIEGLLERAEEQQS